MMKIATFVCTLLVSAIAQCPSQPNPNYALSAPVIVTGTGGTSISGGVLTLLTELDNRFSYSSLTPIDVSSRSSEFPACVAAASAPAFTTDPNDPCMRTETFTFQFADLLEHCPYQTDTVSAASKNLTFTWEAEHTRSVIIGSTPYEKTVTTTIVLEFSVQTEITVTSEPVEVSNINLLSLEIEGTTTSATEGDVKTKLTPFVQDPDRITVNFASDDRIFISIALDDGDAGEGADELTSIVILALGQIDVTVTSTDVQTNMIALSGVLSAATTSLNANFDAMTEIELYTEINSPMQLSPTGITTTTPNGIVSGSWAEIVEDSTACVNNQPCGKMWGVTLTHQPDVCTFTGTYTVTFTVECNTEYVGDGKAVENKDCPVYGRPQSTTFTFALDSGNHCPQLIDGVDLDGSLSTYSSGYPGDAGSNLMEAFLNDEIVYCEAKIQSPQADLASATVSSVRLVKDSTSFGISEGGGKLEYSATTVGGSTDASDLSTWSEPQFEFRTVWNDLTAQDAFGSSWDGTMEIVAVIDVVYAGEAQGGRRRLVGADMKVGETTAATSVKAQASVSAPSTDVGDGNGSKAIASLTPGVLLATSLLILLQ